MIVLGLPCDYCSAATVSHCADGCQWSRCPRCMSYGVPGQGMVKWDRNDYVNPYTLLDVKTAEPQRKFPDWLEGSYGINRNTEAS